MGTLEKLKISDHSFIPGNYQELYDHYIGNVKEGNRLCRMLVRNFLPYSMPEDREAIINDIFLRCMEKKLLDVFDPKKANFGGAIYFVTRSVVSNFLNRRTRDPITGLKAGHLVEEPTEEFEPGQYALSSLFDVKVPEYEKRIDAQKLVKQLYDFALFRFKQPENKRDLSLLPLLNLLMEQRDAKECGEILGVTPSTIYKWISVLGEQALKFRAGEV